MAQTARTKAGKTLPQAAPQVGKPRRAAACPAEAEADKPAPKRRLKRDQRRQFFLEEAAKHFAQYGFSSSTPELAKSLGVAQSLLYKHYRSKDELITEVYAHLSPKPEMYDLWIENLTDRSTPIRDRLINFYRSYAQETWGYERVRILMWANLFKPDLSKHYYTVLETQVFPAMALELRDAASRISDEPPSWRELELVRSLHFGMYHVAGYLRWIAPPDRQSESLEAMMELRVDVFLRGAKDFLGWG